MDDFNWVKDLLGIVGSGGTIAIIVVLWKLGLFKKNGNGNGNGNGYNKILESISSLGDNHIHDIKDHLDRHDEKFDKILLLTEQNNFILKDIREELRNAKKN